MCRKPMDGAMSTGIIRGEYLCDDPIAETCARSKWFTSGDGIKKKESTPRNPNSDGDDPVTTSKPGNGRQGWSCMTIRSLDAQQALGKMVNISNKMTCCLHFFWL